MQAAEIELLQAANATKESAVSRLRDTHSLATPRTQSPAICGRGGIVRQQTSPGLFAGYTVPGLNSAAASQRSLPHPCATMQTAGEKKFTFKNSGQQTLNPGLQSPSLGPRHAHSGTHISGLRTPVPAAKSSHPGAINSYPFTGMKTVGINSEPLNDNSLTSKTFPPLDPVMKSCDSHTVNTKIQPTPSVASGTSQTRSLDFSVLSSNNKSRDPLITNMPAPNSDSGTGSSKIVHGGLGQQNHATNAGAVMTAGAVTTKLDACFSQASVDSSSQQSTSSFKRMPPASRIQAQEQSSVDHISVAKNHAVHSAAVTKGGLNQASAPCNMWDEELSDDILSQLSDDF